MIAHALVVAARLSKHRGRTNGPPAARERFGNGRASSFQGLNDVVARYQNSTGVLEWLSYFESLLTGYTRGASRREAPPASWPLLTCRGRSTGAPRLPLTAVRFRSDIRAMLATTKGRSTTRRGTQPRAELTERHTSTGSAATRAENPGVGCRILGHRHTQATVSRVVTWVPEAARHPRPFPKKTMA
jgi:hypothetical protein